MGSVSIHVRDGRYRYMYVMAGIGTCTGWPVSVHVRDGRYRYMYGMAGIGTCTGWPVSVHVRDGRYRYMYGMAGIGTCTGWPVSVHVRDSQYHCCCMLWLIVCLCNDLVLFLEQKVKIVWNLMIMKEGAIVSDLILISRIQWNMPPLRLYTITPVSS